MLITRPAGDRRGTNSSQVIYIEYMSQTIDVIYAGRTLQLHDTGERAH